MIHLILMTLFLALAAIPVQAAPLGKCFFESDCPKEYTCVTLKGAMNGTCQLRSVAQHDEHKTGIMVDSIIGDDGKCTFNTDCPDGGQCVKQPGALHGKCEGSGYGTPLNTSLLDQKRTCFFDQDCKPGQRCTKPQGSFKGFCEDDFFQNQKDSKDPRTLFKDQFRTSNKKCLQDGDCGIREACVTQERSVFGVCTPKSIIEAQTTTGIFPSSSKTSDPFKF